MITKPLLRVCPFCGGEPTCEVEHEKGQVYYTIECGNTECQVRPQVVHRERGIAIWNWRPWWKTEIALSEHHFIGAAYDHQ